MVEAKSKLRRRTAMVVKKSRKLSSQEPAPVKDDDMVIPLRTRTSASYQHKSKVPFGEIRNVIADTLSKHKMYHSTGLVQGSRVVTYHGIHERVNAEYEAWLITKALMYEDGGFPINAHDEDPPLCKECG